MELTWFRRPSADDPGTLNLCYNVLDLAVIRGRAEEPAVRTAVRTLDVATLLEEAAALAGALRGLGATPGVAVGVDLAGEYDELVALLACLRLGAPAVMDPGAAVVADLLVTSREVPADVAARAVVVRGTDVADPARDLDWDVALQAGRTDPAGCEPVAPGAVAYVLEGPVPVAEGLGHDSRPGRALAALAAGEVLVLEGSDA